MAERRAAWLPVLIVLSAGCSTTVDYAATQIEIPLGEGPVSIAVIDSRANTEDPSWVGIVRSSGAIPFSVTTARGEPLAEAMREALVHAFAKAGHDPKAPGQALPALTLTLKEWATSGYFGSLILRYAVSLRHVTGQRSGEVQLHGTLESTYERRDVYGETCQLLFAEVVGQLLTEVRRRPSRPVVAQPPSDAPPSALPRCQSCQTALEPHWKVCPVCATAR